MDNTTMINITTSGIKSVQFTVELETDILFSTLSLGTFTIMTMLLYLYSKGDENSLGTPTNMGILFFCGLVTFIADLSFHNEDGLLFNVYMSIKSFGFGTLVTFFGAKYLFAVPMTTDIEPIGTHHKSVSFIVCLITIPLVLLEICASIISLISDPLALYAVMRFITIIQKILQGGLYHFSLRHKAPKENKYCSASWYFKIIALFNFSMWLQSIMEAEKDDNVPLKGNLRHIYIVFASTYYALMIDYRLLCCLLFMEHAYEIDKRKSSPRVETHDITDDQNIASYWIPPNNDGAFYKKIRSMSKYGFFFGTLLVVLQLVNASENLKNVGPWVNFVGFLAEISVVVQGYALIRQVRPSNKSKGEWRETNSKGIDLMVAMMGVTGLAFWLLKSTLVAIWIPRLSETNYSQDIPFLTWFAVKSSIRSFGCVVHIYLYTRAHPSLGCQVRIKHNASNHFLLPCLMMSFLAVFVNSVIDSYSAVIKTMVKRAHLHTVVYAFYEAGAPIHLGFCLHLFIHYFLIYSRMKDSITADMVRYKIEDVPNQVEACTNLLADVEDDDNKNMMLIGEGKKF